MMFMHTTMPETFNALQQQYAEQFGVLLQLTADVEPQILGLGDSITNTIGQSFLDLLHNTDDALHHLGGWVENARQELRDRLDALAQKARANGQGEGERGGVVFPR